MTANRIEDLADVSIEHMLGDRIRPLVKLRAESDATVLIGQLTPAQAREIAEHLHEAAARAEYEYDLWTAARNVADMPEETIGSILMLVRTGEARRHQIGDQG